MYACIHVWGRVRACVRVFVCMCVCEIEPGALLITPAWHGATHLLLRTPRVMASWHRRRALQGLVHQDSEPSLPYWASGLLGMT